MWGWIAKAGLWLLGLFTRRGSAATPAQTAEGQIIANAPQAAHDEGVNQQALAQAQRTIKDAEAQDATEAKATAAVGDAQRRVVRESDQALASDPDAHYRD